MVITYSDFSNIRRLHKDQKIVLATGSFDLLHAGHVVFFEDCKDLGGVLVVGIGSDEACREKAPDRPIMNEHQRLKVLDNIKPVDYTFIHKSPPKGSKYHNVFAEEILEKLRPDKWVMIKESSEIPYRKKISDKYGVELVLTERHCPPEFENVSTSKIIEKIRGKKSSHKNKF